MRAGHGGTAQRIAGRCAAVPGRANGRARRIQLDAAAVIGIVCHSIALCRGTYRDRCGLAAGRTAAGVIGPITGSHHYRNAQPHQVSHCSIHRHRLRRTQGDIGDRRARRSSCYPVQSCDHPADRSRTIAIEHPHRDQPNALGNTANGAAQSAGHMRAVAHAIIAIAAVLNHAIPCQQAPAKFAMVRSDAAIDHIGCHPSAAVAEMVLPVQWAVHLVDSIQAPRRLALNHTHLVHINGAVRLYRQHLRV